MVKMKNIESVLFMVELYKIVEWSDEECDKWDNDYHITLKIVRGIVKQNMTLLGKYNELIGKYNDVTQKLNELNNKYSNLTGYIVKCPNCGVEYYVKVGELNHNTDITCMDCGHKYFQNNNIISIELIHMKE